MKDIPYSVLKKDKRAYEMMLLRDQYGNTFADIAAEFNLSVTRTAQIYYRLKTKQIRLYIRHISVALGYDDTSQIRKVYQKAEECYRDYSCTCAYLEKKYEEILTGYRGGEPGMPAQFVENIPPFKARLSQKTIARVVEMREVDNASFITIGKKLRITPAKARHTYEMFYHKQVLELIRTLREEAESDEEKRAVSEYYSFRGKLSSKRCYDILTEGRSWESGGTPDLSGKKGG